MSEAVPTQAPHTVPAPAPVATASSPVRGAYHPEDENGNLALGSTLPALATGAQNTAIGVGASASITTATKQTVLGFGALPALKTGQSNLALGTAALGHLTSGSWNTAIAGEEALYELKKGESNICIGNATLRSIRETKYMLAIGDNALLEMLTGSADVFIGFSAGELLEETADTVAIGNNAIKSIAGGIAKNTVGIGNAALYSAKTTYYDVAIGADSIAEATKAAYNVAIGYNALGEAKTAENNVCIGYEAGLNCSGTSSGNVIIGYQAGPTGLAETSNRLYINNAASATPLILGNFETKELRINGTLTATTGALEVGEPKAEAEITESGKGNGEKEPSATKPTQVYLRYKMKEDKAASMKVEVNGVVVYECEESAVASLKSTETAQFIVPAGKKFKVTFSECEKIIPVYQII